MNNRTRHAGHNDNDGRNPLFPLNVIQLLHHSDREQKRRDFQLTKPKHSIWKRIVRAFV